MAQFVVPSPRRHGRSRETAIVRKTKPKRGKFNGTIRRAIVETAWTIKGNGDRPKDKAKARKVQWHNSSCHRRDGMDDQGKRRSSEIPNVYDDNVVLRIVFCHLKIAKK